jgi:hypothetical protein
MPLLINFSLLEKLLISANLFVVIVLFFGGASNLSTH